MPSCFMVLGSLHFLFPCSEQIYINCFSSNSAEIQKPLSCATKKRKRHDGERPFLGSGVLCP